MTCELRILDFNYVFQDNVTLTASSADPMFPVSNLKNQSRAFPWRTTGVDMESLLIDLQTTQPIDSVCLFFDPTVGIKISDGATIKIQASATNVWTSPPVDQALTIDSTNGVISHYFSTDQNYRYWRLYIDDPLGGYTYIEIPKIFLTKASKLTQGPKKGFGFKETDRSKPVQTEYGHEYTDIYPTLRSMDFSFEAITDADRQTLREIFERVGHVRTIAVVLDPLDSIFDGGNFTVYGKLRGEFQEKHSVFSFFDSGLTIEEVI